MTPGRRHNRRRNEDDQVANGLEEEHIPLEDMGGATGGDNEDTLTPLIHSAPEEQATEANAVKGTEQNVPPQKTQMAP